MFRIILILSVLSLGACSPRTSHMEGFKPTYVSYTQDLTQFNTWHTHMIRGKSSKDRNLWLGVASVYQLPDFQVNRLRYATAHEMIALLDQHPDLVANRNRICAFGTPFPDGYPLMSLGPQYFRQKEIPDTRFGIGLKSCDWAVLVEK